MLKYRVLDKERNQFLPTEGLFLSSEGVVYFNWVIQDKEKIEVQPALNLGEKALLDIYIGDAISIKIPDKGTFHFVDNRLFNANFKYVPKKYDEVIIQIERTNNELITYWVLFKLNGEFVKTEDVEGIFDECQQQNTVTDESTGKTKKIVTISETTTKRAIPSDNISLLASLVALETCSKLYDCTGDYWFDWTKE